MSKIINLLGKMSIASAIVSYAYQNQKEEEIRVFFVSMQILLDLVKFRSLLSLTLISLLIPDLMHAFFSRLNKFPLNNNK